MYVMYAVMFMIRRQAIHEELKLIFDDCNEYEKNVIGEILVNAKKRIRRNLPLIDKEK